MVNTSMLSRLHHTEQVSTLLKQFPVVAMLGARQVGKTTLARQLASDYAQRWLDLENSRDLETLREPQVVLEHIDGLVAIDEVQRPPDLFPLLRVLVDRTSATAGQRTRAPNSTCSWCAVRPASASSSSAQRRRGERAP